VKYLKHILSAIERLDYVRYEYATMFAVLLEDGANAQPRDLARLFRSFGTPLSPDARKALGLHPNALLTEEALAALTDLGRQDPIHALETTLQAAAWSYTRENAVAAGARVGGGKFCVEGKFGDCRGCRRLNGQIVTKDFLDSIPPIDCTREACALGLKPHEEPKRVVVG
jgi:hypothetical protein